MIYGWGEVLRKDMPLGVKLCPKCGYTMFYLARVVFRVHICFIPVFWQTKRYYVMCGACESGREISKEEYTHIEAIHKSFCKKKDLKECYMFIGSLTQNMFYDDNNVEYILKQLKERYPINDEVLSTQYRDLISLILKLKTQNVNS